MRVAHSVILIAVFAAACLSPEVGDGGVRGDGGAVVGSCAPEAMAGRCLRHLDLHRHELASALRPGGRRNRNL